MPLVCHCRSGRHQGAKRERRKRRQPLGAALAPLGREQRACLRRVFANTRFTNSGYSTVGVCLVWWMLETDGPVTRPLCAMGSTFTAYMHSSDVLNWCLNLGVLLFPALDHLELLSPCFLQGLNLAFPSVVGVQAVALRLSDLGAFEDDLLFG